jgi:2-polyprenyl-3-methyl-5-hydroxy-6-metoxy-1,4-benzoquinol methylase
MNWKQFWNNKASASEEAAQVGRIMAGKPLDERVLEKIAKQIQTQLHVKPSDSLLDVCCGNAQLSELLLPYCQEVVGVDFSEKLIEEANKKTAGRISLHVGDAAHVALNQSFDKVLLYFSFQYFETYEYGKKVIANLLAHAKPGALILIGDICDQRKFFSYYHSPKKYLHYLKQKMQNQQDMGKFWHPAELDQICKELGVKGHLQEQEAWQPYAHYRFDYLIEK